MLFLYAPILTLIVFSFNDSKSRAKWGGFTLKWYKNMLNDPMISKSIYYTLLIALLAAVISTVIGTLAAIGIHVMKKKTKTVVLNVTYCRFESGHCYGNCFYAVFCGNRLKAWIYFNVDCP